MKFIDVTGRSEEEAINRALAQLSLERDDVSVEVLERAKSGFLGLGSSPAKVRVSYEDPSEKVLNNSASIVEKIMEMPSEKPKTPVKIPVLKVKTEEPKHKNVETVQSEDKAEAIKVFLTGLLAQLEIPATVEMEQVEKGRYHVNLVGENLGALIGRRGETLDAIQQLTSYAVNREGVRVRLQLDAENYREKREQSLENLANKVAGKVVKYHRNVTLEPMNAYERHVIHTALQDVAGISTYSTGTDPNRRVIVALGKK